MRIKSLYILLSAMAITVFVGGFSYIYFDGFTSIKIQEQNQDLVHQENRKLIGFISAFKTFSSKNYTNVRELTSSHRDLVNSFESLDFLEIKDSEVFNDNFSRLKTLQKELIFLSSTIKDETKLLEKRKNDLEKKLSFEITQRLKNAQEFMPGLKKTLSNWGEDIPFFTKIKEGIDKSYVDKEKISDLQNLMLLSKALVKKDYVLESKEIRKYNLNLSLLIDIEVLSELIGKQRDILEKKNTQFAKALKNFLKTSKSSEVLVNEKLLNLWRNHRATGEEDLLKQRNTRHQLVLDMMTFMGVFIIVMLLIIFLKIFPYLSLIKKRADIISEGNFEQRFENIPNNEFGNVMLAFNNMSQEILSYIDKLSEQRLKEVALSESIQKVNKLNAMGELTAKMGHEIKNPIAILNFCLSDAVDFLESGDTSGAKKELEKSKTALDRLILITKKLENKEFNVNGSVLSLQIVINELAVMYENRGNLNIDIDKDDIEVFAPKLELQSALSNLLDNAFESGSTDVSVDISANDSYAIIDVRNSGLKFDEEEKVFNNFYSTKNGQGRGVGLAIVKDIASLCKGEVSYSYKEGQHCFSLKIPRYYTS